MKYTITGQDWGEPIEQYEANTEKEVIDIVLNDIVVCELGIFPRFKPIN